MVEQKDFDSAFNFPIALEKNKFNRKKLSIHGKYFRYSIFNLNNSALEECFVKYKKYWKSTICYYQLTMMN